MVFVGMGLATRVRAVVSQQVERALIGLTPAG